MLNSVLEAVLRCSHRRTTFPMTPKAEADRQVTYVTCLDCGQKFGYDWNQMHMLGPIESAGRPAGETRIQPARETSVLPRFLRFGGGFSK